MGDNGRADARPRREAKSAVRHSKAELLQAIAARRQAQLLRSINTPSRRPGWYIHTLKSGCAWRPIILCFGVCLSASHSL